MKSIVVLDSIFAIRYRIKILGSLADIKVIEVNKPEQLVNLLRSPNDIALIITELEFAHQDSFLVFDKIMAYARKIPVMILTSENKRTSFVKAMQCGASDYVLKPFDGEYLLKRIIDLMGSEMPRIPIQAWEAMNKDICSMSIDFNSYVDKELKKASKGKYAISIMMSIITDSTNKMNGTLDKRYHVIYKELHHNLSAVIFDTDLLMNHSSGSFIGVFPFCGPEDQNIINEKLISVFEEYNQENEIEQTIQLVNTFVSYPEDGKNREELIAVVNERMMKAIHQIIHIDKDENED